MHSRSVLLLLGFVVACNAAPTEEPKPDRRKPEVDEGKTTEPEVDEPEPKPPGDPNLCMPPGLEGASKVETLALPRGCQVVAPGALLSPTVVRSEAELAEAITCDPGVQLPAIDFGKQQLHVANFMLSPAYGGSELVDDGKLVTFVQRDRSPCPDDPQPMPTPSSLAYLLPQGAERGYAQLACSLPPRCD